VPVGLSLFVGEWLFGSLGWGVLHGPLFLLAIGVACLVAAVGMGGGSIARDFLAAAVTGAVVGVALGLDMTNQAWARLGDAIAPGIEAGVRPLVVGAGVTALVFAIGGLLIGARSGGAGGAARGILGGAAIGAITGGFLAIAFGPRVGAAVGVTVGLIAWPSLMGANIARVGVDTDALKARFWPTQTIETTKETIEWVRERTPLGPRS
jgi:hypothetical protein